MKAGSMKNSGRVVQFVLRRLQQNPLKTIPSSLRRRAVSVPTRVISRRAGVEGPSRFCGKSVLYRSTFSASGDFAHWARRQTLLSIRNFVTPLSQMVLSSLGPSTPARHAVTGKADLPLAFAQDDGFLKESLSQRSPKGL